MPIQLVTAGDRSDEHYLGRLCDSQLLLQVLSWHFRLLSRLFLNRAELAIFLGHLLSVHEEMEKQLLFPRELFSENDNVSFIYVRSSGCRIRKLARLITIFKLWNAVVPD